MIFSIAKIIHLGILRIIIYNFITSFRRETQKKLWPYEKSEYDFPKELWLKYEVFFWLNSVVDEEYIPKDIVAIYFRITKYDFSEI